MASELQVDELKGVTADGDITITSEGGSATMQLQQGVLKVWGNITHSSPLTINDSLNTSSLTDYGTGDAQPNYTNNMANDDYSVTSSAEKSADHSSIFHNGGINPNTSNSGLITGTALNTTTDAEFASYQIAGDLA